MSYTHLRDENRRSRKPHRCYLCGKWIRWKALHVARTGVDEQGRQTVHMHAVCESLTHGWDADAWEYHDPGEFCTYELRLPLIDR